MQVDVGKNQLVSSPSNGVVWIKGMKETITKGSQSVMV